MMRLPNTTKRPGFTLIEVLIVVVILGILASVVTTAFAGVADDARRTAFARTVKMLGDQCESYRARTGLYLPDSSSGDMPSQLLGWIKEADFEGGTPLGGDWDIESGSGGIVSYGVGVHFQTASAFNNDAEMNLVDAIFDDGDVTTGTFRRIESGRYYLVLDP